MKVSEEVPSRSELHCVLVNKLNHIGVTRMKKTMTQGSKETLAKAFKLVFQAKNTGIKVRSFS